MAKRKNQLSDKLGGSQDARLGWRDTIRLNQPQQPAEPAQATPSRQMPPSRPAEQSNKPKRKTYLLTPDLIANIEQLADEERVGINELVRFLLGTAVNLVETGQIEIPTTPGRRKISR